MLFGWKRGKLAPRVEIPDSSVLRLRIIDKGYHSCRDLKIVPNHFNDIGIIKEAFFSPIYGLLIMRRQERFIMLTCIIPKGTKYYENEYGEIVSETIKIL